MKALKLHFNSWCVCKTKLQGGGEPNELYLIFYFSNKSNYVTPHYTCNTVYLLTLRPVFLYFLSLSTHEIRIRSCNCRNDCETSRTVVLEDQDWPPLLWSVTINVYQISSKMAMENRGNGATAGTAIRVSALSYERTDWSLAWNTKKKETYSYSDFKIKKENIHCFK